MGNVGDLFCVGWWGGYSCKFDNQFIKEFLSIVEGQEKQVLELDLQVKVLGLEYWNIVVLNLNFLN